MDRSFEYKIQLSVGAKDFSPDIEKILKNAQAKADKNAVEITITGDQKDLIKQLIDFKKKLPNYDLTDGIEIHLADALLEQSEAGKKIIGDLATTLANELQRAMADIGSVDEMIGNVQKKIRDLEKRKLQLYDDKEIKDASSAFDAAEKRFQEASTKFNNTTGKVQQRNLDNMRNAYQDMVNFEKEAGKSASAVLNRTQQNMGKNVEKEILQGYQSLNDIKPTGTYAEAVKTINEQLLEQQSILQNLNAQRDELLNPTVAVKGKLVDTFKQDIQSQIDELGTIEVKVKPKVDGETKVEVETAVDEKPTKILKQDTDEIVSDTETAVKNFERLSDRVKKYQESKADKRLANPSIVDRRKGRGFENISELVPAYPEDVRNNSTTKTGIKRKLDEYLKQKKELETGVTEYGSKALATEKTLSRALDELAAYTYSFKDAEEAAEIFGEKNKDVFDLVQERIELAKKASKANTEAGWYKDFIIHDSLRGDYGVGKITIGEADQLMNAIESNGLEGFAAKVEELFGVKIPTSIEQAKTSIQSVNEAVSTTPNVEGLDKTQTKLNETTQEANETTEAITEVNISASTPLDISGQDRERAELNETAEAAYKAGEALKKYHEIMTQGSILENGNINEKAFNHQQAFYNYLSHLDLSKIDSNELLSIWEEQRNSFTTPINSSEWEAKNNIFNLLKKSLEDLGYVFDGAEQKWSKLNQTISQPVDTSTMDKIEEEHHEEAVAAQEAADAERNLAETRKQAEGQLITVYRAYNHTAGIMGEEGMGWFSDDPETMKTYVAQNPDRNVVKGQIDTSKFFKLDAQGAKAAAITYLGDQSDEASKKITEVYNKIQAIKKELAEKPSDALSEELKNLELEYDALSEDKSNMYGTHSSRQFAIRAKEAGYKGIEINNVVDDYNMKSGKTSTTIALFDNEALRETEDITSQIKGNIETTQQAFDRQSAINSHADFLLSREDINETETDIDILTNKLEELNEDNRLVSESAETLGEKLREITTATSEGNADIQNIKDYYSPEIGDVFDKETDIGKYYDYLVHNTDFGTTEEEVSAAYEQIAQKILDFQKEVTNIIRSKIEAIIGGSNQEGVASDTTSSAIDEITQAEQREAEQARKTAEEERKLNEARKEVVAGSAFNSFHEKVLDYRFSDDMSPWIPMDGDKADPKAYSAVRSELNSMADTVLKLQNEYENFDTNRPIRELEKLEDELRDAEVRFAGTYSAANQYWNEGLDRPANKGGASKKVQDLYGYIMSGSGYFNNEAWERNSKLLESKAQDVSDHIQQIFMSLGTNQISSQNLFNWIEENGTIAEKEILRINYGLEEFRKVLRGLAMFSGGQFDFAETFGLDTVTLNQNSLSSDTTAPLTESRPTTSQLEKEAEVKRDDIAATNELIEAEKKLREEASKPIPNIIDAEFREIPTTPPTTPLLLEKKDDYTRDAFYRDIGGTDRDRYNKGIISSNVSDTMSKANSEASTRNWVEGLEEVKTQATETGKAIKNMWNVNDADKSVDFWASELHKAEEEAVAAETVAEEARSKQAIFDNGIDKRRSDVDNVKLNTKEDVEYSEELQERINEVNKELVALKKNLDNITTSDQLKEWSSKFDVLKSKVKGVNQDIAEENKSNQNSSKNSLKENKSKYVELLKEENALKLQLKTIDSQEDASKINEKIDAIQKEKEAIKEIIKAKGEETFVTEKQREADEAYAQSEKKLADDAEALEKKRLNLLQQITQWLKSNPIAERKYGSLLSEGIETLNSSARVTPEILKQIETEFKKVKLEATKAGDTGAGFFQILKQRWQSLGAYLGSFASFYRVTAYVRQAIESIHELDDALTEMRKVSDESVSTLKAFQQESFAIADQVGSTAKVIQNSTADWLRLGESLEEAKESAKDASILLNVSEFSSIDEATTALVAMSQAYKEMDKIDIIDKLNNIGNNFSISTDQLATGLQNAAAVLKTQGNDIDKSIALLTAANSIVQDISKASTGMRTIALRIAGTETAKKELEELGESVDDYIVQTQSKTQETIKAYTAVASNAGRGVDVLDTNGNLRDTYDILLDISKIYKEIQEEDKKAGTNRAKALVEYIAGKNRSNIAASVLENPELLEEVYKASQDSAGSALEENEKYLDSISGHIAKLQNQLQKLYTDTIDSGFVKWTLDLLTNVTKLVDKVGLLRSAIIGIATVIGSKKLGYCNQVGSDIHPCRS